MMIIILFIIFCCVYQLTIHHDKAYLKHQSIPKNMFISFINKNYRYNRKLVCSCRWYVEHYLSSYIFFNQAIIEIWPATNNFVDNLVNGSIYSNIIIFVRWEQCWLYDRIFWFDLDLLIALANPSFDEVEYLFSKELLLFFILNTGFISGMLLPFFVVGCDVVEPIYLFISRT